MKRAAILIAATAVPVAFISVGALTPSSHHRPPRPAPIRTSAQLARRIRAADLKALSGGDALGPIIHVDCRPVTPHGNLAGQYDHRCHETIQGGFCTSGGLEVDLLLIDVHGRSYTTFSDQQLMATECVLEM